VAVSTCNVIPAAAIADANGTIVADSINRATQATRWNRTRWGNLPEPVMRAPNGMLEPGDLPKAIMESPAFSQRLYSSARARGSVECTATAGEARVSHELDVWALPLGSGEEPLPQTVGAQDLVLGVIVEVCLHDLVGDLLVHGRVLDRNERLGAAVEVSRIQSADEMNTRAWRRGPSPARRSARSGRAPGRARRFF
jgi:hypothetical protein